MCVPTRLLVSLAVVCSVSLMSGAAAVSAQEMTSTEKDLMKLFGGKVTASPQKTKKGIVRSSLPDASMAPMTRTYLETYGPQKGKTFTRTIKQTRTYPKKWPDSPKGAVTDTIPGDFVFYEILDADRGLVIQLEFDIHSSVQVVYEPGQIVVPNTGDVAPYDMKVLVYDITNPTSVKHNGNLKVTTTDRGQWTVKTPAGEFDCVMFTMTYDGKVGPATVKDSAIAFVNPDHGIIARVTRNKISAFLVYNADDRFAYTLVEKPAD